MACESKVAVAVVVEIGHKGFPHNFRSENHSAALRPPLCSGRRYRSPCTLLPLLSPGGVRHVHAASTADQQRSKTTTVVKLPFLKMNPWVTLLVSMTGAEL
jgi:hypothetical protein